MGFALPILSPIPPARTCVWMDAGVVAFRLCDHGFACEHCSFDAAMRGDPRAHTIDEFLPASRASAAWCFPADRLYTRGHLWVQLIRDGRVRAGIDACASRLLPPLRQVRLTPAPIDLRVRDPLCTLIITGGELPLASPVSGRVCCWNESLVDTPSLLNTEPYAGGWLAELTLPRSDDLDRFLPADAANAQADRDARLFRRQVAFHLLSLEGGPEPWIDATSLEATQCLLGTDPFVALARQILH
jgi:glycine cleavage system H protein